LNITNWI